MAKAVPMTEIDIADDEALRFIQRVLESDAPREDRDRAAQMVRDIRTRVRKAYAASGVAPFDDGRPLFDPMFPEQGYVSDAEWAARKARTAGVKVVVDQPKEGL